MNVYSVYCTFMYSIEFTLDYAYNIKKKNILYGLVYIIIIKNYFNNRFDKLYKK